MWRTLQDKGFQFNLFCFLRIYILLFRKREGMIRPMTRLRWWWFIFTNITQRDYRFQSLPPLRSWARGNVFVCFATVCTLRLQNIWKIIVYRWHAGCWQGGRSRSRQLVGHAVWEAAVILERCFGNIWAVLLWNIGVNGRMMIENGRYKIFYWIVQSYNYICKEAGVMYIFFHTGELGINV